MTNIPQENPDLVVHGSYKGRKITAVRKYRHTAYPAVECIANFDDYDLGDPTGTGATPEEALDDLLESAELRDTPVVYSDPADQARYEELKRLDNLPSCE